MYVCAQAVSALKSCPIVYAHPKQLSVLKGIGPSSLSSQLLDSC